MDVIEKEKVDTTPFMYIGMIHSNIVKGKETGIGEVLDFVERYPDTYYMFVKLPNGKYAINVGWRKSASWGPNQPSLIYADYDHAAKLWQDYRTMYRNIAFNRLYEITAGDKVYDHESVECHQAVFLDF